MAVSEKTMELYGAMAQADNSFVDAIQALPIPRKDINKLLRMYVKAKSTAEQFHEKQASSQYIGGVIDGVVSSKHLVKH